ncbi:MAG: DinB family protein [Bacteroidota bacterium]
MRRPLPQENQAYFQHYIDLVKNDDVLQELNDQLAAVQLLIASVPSDKEDFSYAPHKWSIKQVIGHLADTERIMAYRVLRFSRKDKTNLSGFDENTYVANADFNNRTLAELGHEFTAMRSANLLLFKHLNEATLDETGFANGREASVRAILFMMAGHVLHHLNVLKTNYLTVA